jgi:hypothetical protein
MAYLSALGLVSVIYLFFVLARLSERLGSVEKMIPRYRYYYVAIAFITVGLFSYLAAIQIGESPFLRMTWIPLLTYHLPLAVGVTIGLAVTWWYWSWLLKDKR